MHTAHTFYLVEDICHNILHTFFLSIGTDLDMQDMDQMIVGAVQRAEEKMEILSRQM